MIPTKFASIDSLRDEVRGAVPHDDQVLEWRESEFQRMGFVAFMADFLATTRIDLHQMEALLKKGCPHRTAVEILIGTAWWGEDETWRWTEEGEYLNRAEDYSEAA